MNMNIMSPHLRLRLVLLATALFGPILFSRAAEPPPKPFFPGIAPVCPCESLANVSIPNTRIDSATLDPSNGSCRVTATVTHPPAGDRVKVFIGLPVTNWNGRFQGNGGGGFSGGSAGSLRGPVARGYAAGEIGRAHV